MNLMCFFIFYNGKITTAIIFSRQVHPYAASLISVIKDGTMAASTFFIPSVNVIGTGALKEAMNTMAEYGFRRTLIVTDSMLTTLGMAGDIQKALQERDIFSVIYDGTRLC